MAYQVEFVQVGVPSVESWNIDKPVGATSGYNRPDDVMLVQALLRLCFYELDGAKTPPLSPPEGHSGLAVDGKCGPATQKHIRQFKDWMRTAGQATVADGKIDPVPSFSTDFAKTRHGVIYTMDLLDSCARHWSVKAGHPELYRFKSRTNDIPLALRSALTRSKVVY